MTLSAFALFGASCSDAKLTQLVVVVDSDLEVPAELEAFELEILGTEGETVFTESYDLTASEAPALPVTLGLTPGSDELAPITVRATGFTADGTIERVVRSGFVAGETRAVLLFLLARCADVSCPSEQSCGPSGSCVSVDVPPEALPEWQGEPPAFDAGAADAGVDARAPVDGGADAADAAADAGCVDSECPEDEVVPTTSCSGFDDVCDETGTWDVEVTSYTCEGGSCQPSTTTEQRPCTRPSTDGEPCSDGNMCTTNDQCQGGVCQGDPTPCLDPCTCDPATGECTGDGGFCGIQQ